MISCFRFLLTQKHTENISQILNNIVQHCHMIVLATLMANGGVLRGRKEMASTPPPFPPNQLDSLETSRQIQTTSMNNGAARDDVLKRQQI